MRNFTFHIVTLGCKVNQYESEVIREAWLAAGGQETLSLSEAQYICINSCAVTSHAERESRNAVYRARRSNPDAHITVTGCAANLIASFRPRKNTFWTPPDRITQNKGELLSGPLFPNEFAPQEFFPPAPLPVSTRSRPTVKIQDGCGQHCTYCIVPQNRGASISRHPDTVLAEINGFFASGRSEIVLSGINLRQYGKDQPAYGDFWQLLRFLDDKLFIRYGNTKRIRLSSLDPAMLDERGLSILRDCSLVCPHLHLSIQHVQKNLLKKMGRAHYDAEMIQKNIIRLGNFWKMFGLGADFIVGFPGEDDNDFTELLRFIEDMPFSYAHIFPFSARPGTPAAKFPAQLPRKIKQERVFAARAAIGKRRETFLRRQLELQNMRIAREAGEAKIVRGINEYYIPCYFSHSESQLPGLVDTRPVKTFKDGLWVVQRAAEI